MQPKAKQKPRIGEILLEHGLITSHNLKEALKIQSQKGGQIGSILIDLGYVSTETLLDFLGRQLGIPTTNLFQIDIQKDVLHSIPLHIIKNRKVLPLEVDEHSISLAMVKPNDLMAINEIEFLTGKRINPIIVPSAQFDLAIKSIEEKGSDNFIGSQIFQLQKKEVQKGLVSMETMLEFLASSEASDMLITAGSSPAIKRHNALKRSDFPPLSSEQCVTYAKTLMTARQWEEFLKKKESEFTLTVQDVGRFRINVYRQRNSVSISIRHILEIIPSFPDLGLPGWLEDYVLKTHGLILVTGPAGHGKSTTLASMIDLINTKRRCNIISLENPIEHLHKHKNSNVNQREIGNDTESFPAGIRGIIRQSPDVIVIGDLTDNETIEVALQAASTGHLVLSTLQAANATSAIEIIVSRFLPHQQPRVSNMIADTLLLVFAQRLLPGKGSDSRVLAYEKLINSYRIKNLIRDNKVHQIRVQIQSDSDDFSSRDVSLLKLLKGGKITPDDACYCADSPEYIKRMGK
jgi:twitching motility protein PilT